MKRWLATATAGLAALMILGLAMAVDSDDARAKPGYTIHPARAWKFFEIRGTHGYSIFVTLEGERVSLEAISRSSTVRYTAVANTKNGRTKARLGRLGVLSMRFSVSGPFSPITEPQGDCRGRRAQVQKGIFEGAFRWRGEKNFSAARTHKVSGLSVQTFREVCKGETAAIGRDEAEKPLLVVRSKTPRGRHEVEAYGSPEEGIGLIGRVIEERDRLRTERSVFSFVGNEEIQVDPEGNLLFAAPDPFRGSAEFRANTKEPERWRGNLEADFPGRGFLPLSGESFAVR